MQFTLGATKNESFTLPSDAVTQTFAILAKKGSGKSYTASVMAEEFLRREQQIVVLDPTGSWFGLQSSADGKHNGYPIVVFGGDFANVPLEPSAGEVIAQAIVEKGFSAILDLSLMRKGEMSRFVAAFLSTMYRLNRQPVHLFVDEADAFAPQRPFGEEAFVLGAMEDIVRRGRRKGIGCTMITQRPQVLNKNVLTQCECLITLRLGHPKDIKAIEEWIAVHGDEKLAVSMIESLPSLPIGTAWFWSPGWGDIFARVEIRKRTTFDSGATPKPGEKARRPQKLAQIDIEALGKVIQDTVDRKRSEDPKQLQKRIADLERQLKVVPKLVADPKSIETAIAKVSAERDKVWQGEFARLKKIIDTTGAALAKILAGIGTTEVNAALSIVRTKAEIVRTNPDIVRTPRNIVREKTKISHGSVSGPQRQLLETLAWWEAMGHTQPSRAQVAAVAGWRVTSGHLKNVCGSLRTLELIDYPSQGSIALTDAGRAIAPTPDTSRSLVDRVRGILTGPQLMVFDSCMTQGRQTRSQMCEHLGWSESSGHAKNVLGSMRTLELLDYPVPGEVELQSWLTE